MVLANKRFIAESTFFVYNGTPAMIEPEYTVFGGLWKEQIKRNNCQVLFIGLFLHVVSY